jgi:hypothetical protein
MSIARRFRFKDFSRFACLGAALLVFPGTARCWELSDFFGSTPLVYDERLPGYSNVVEACASPAALNEIHDHFQKREEEYWHSGLQIVAFTRVAEIRGLPHAAYSIAQRNCTATALMNDGRKHIIRYGLVENAGWLGLVDGAVFCVSGLDPFARDCTRFSW